MRIYTDHLGRARITWSSSPYSSADARWEDWDDTGVTTPDIFDTPADTYDVDDEAHERAVRRALALLF